MNTPWWLSPLRGWLRAEAGVLRLKASMRGRRTVLVHQMPKTASESIEASLRARRDLDAAVLRTHFLNPDNLRLQERFARQDYPASIHRNFERHFPFHAVLVSTSRVVLDHVRRGRKILVVSAFRDPVARNVSEFFQRIDRYYPRLQEQVRAGELTVERLRAKFLGLSDRDVPLDWFDTETRAVLGIDVYAEPFPRQAGYAIFRSERADLLVFTVEKIRECAQRAFREFLGIEGFRPAETNITAEKDVAGLYGRFVQEVRLPGDYLDRMYGSKAARHFYDDEQLRRFRLKWSRAGSPDA